MPAKYRVPAARAACHDTTEPDTCSAPAERLRREERILVVDDNPRTTLLVREQLSFEGFAAGTINDSEAVMELLASEPYDLVLLDINMPPPDGLTLLGQMQADDPYRPVVMLTGYGDADTAARAMREGAADYVVKPYEPAQLVARIERALEHSELLRDRARSRELLERRVTEQTRALHTQSEQLSLMLERVLDTYSATLRALEAMLDVRDQSAPGHCRRVARLAVSLGTYVRLSESELVALEHGALLHDIGKLGIPDSILLKTGPLTEKEWSVMRQHPEIGCGIIGHIDFLAGALPVIRHHHERYDGAGYPDGLAGDDIPLLARIFGVVDAFDALTNQRPYNVVQELEHVLDLIRHASGTQFDPRIVEQFVDMSLKHTPT